MEEKKGGHQNKYDDLLFCCFLLKKVVTCNIEMKLC